MTRPIRVLLVDDDALVLSGLKLLLGGAEHVAVVGEAHVSRLLAKLGAANRVQIDLLVESAASGRGGVSPGG